MKKPIKTKSKSRFTKSEYPNYDDNSDFIKNIKKEIVACEFCGILHWKDSEKRCKCDLI